MIHGTSAANLSEAILVLSSSWRESSSALTRLNNALKQNGMSLSGSTDVSGWPGLRGRGVFMAIDSFCMMLQNFSKNE